MTAPGLDSLIDDLFTRPDSEGISLALLIQQGGDVVVERYGVQPENIFQPATPITAQTTLTSWSMAKSITHAAVGLLVADGLIDVEAPAVVPEWAGTDKAGITLLQMLEMRSGLRFVEDYVDDEISNCTEMLFAESGPSHAAYAAALPLDHPPGSFYNYSSGTTNIVARIVGDVVHGVGGVPAERQASIEEFLHDRLFEPVGMSSAVPKFDGAGDFVGSSYVFATARDFAKFGELYRHDGITSDGVRILPERWSNHARGFSALDPDNGCEYGRHWWMWPDLESSLVCQGYEGQFIAVVPARELVVVHLGKTPADTNADLRVRLRAMIQRF